MKHGEENKRNSKDANKRADYALNIGGQVTYICSLAERVRRERISERMKLLQAFAPGSDKVVDFEIIV
ncbi:hypothetical protein ACP275_09G060500 [Erythranthe tilingii]